MGGRARNWRRLARATGLSALLVAGSLLSGCSSSDGEASRSDAEQCQDLMDTYCAKTAACVPSSERVNRGEDCEFSLKLQTSCEDLKVQGNMNGCLDSIDIASCASFDATKESLPWPDACKGVLGPR